MSKKIEINQAGQEFFTIIDGNIDVIIKLFPFSYKTQKEVIFHIINNLNSKEIPPFKINNE